MKLLRSPWVTGLLVVIALVVVAVQFAPLHWRSAVVELAQAAVSVPAAPEPKTASKSEAEKPELPTEAVDRQLVQDRFQNWAAAPGRDPFLLVPVSSDAPVHKYPSPVLVWKLKAIWRQTNGRVAAINKGIYAEGDKIDGYPIKRIEADQVWFDGPDGPEVLTFAPPGSTPGKKKP